MDDLLGEDWQSSSKPPNISAYASTNPSTFASTYSNFRSSPVPSNSGTASPQSISRPSSTLNGGTKAAAEDKFGNLLSLKSQKPTGNVSIQERQKQLIEDRRRQQQQQAQLWDTLGSGRGTPVIREPSPVISQAEEEEDDILAAFNKSAPVDKASHFPPPSSGAVSGSSTPGINRSLSGARPSPSAFDLNDDDDPFGLGSMPKQSNGHIGTNTIQQTDDDGDVLGDLGKPLDELPAKAPPAQPKPQSRDESRSTSSIRDSESTVNDRALAQLVDLGFSGDTSKIALAENNGNVQRAVEWLFEQANEESKQSSREAAEQQSHRSRRGPSPPGLPSRSQDAAPAWMQQEERARSGSRRQDSQSPGVSEKDPAQLAQELGSKLFKSANSLWKASQTKVVKTVSEFQQDRDPSQPKWMQEPATSSTKTKPQASRKEAPPTRLVERSDIEVTDEAVLLDMPRERPQKARENSRQTQAAEPPALDRLPSDILPQRPSPKPRFAQQPPSSDRNPATKLRRQEVEEQTAQAYISPARRKRPTPKSEPPLEEPVVDLFSSAPSRPKPTPMPSDDSSKIGRAPSAIKPAAAPSRPKVAPRSIPEISPSALSKSATYRKAGGDAFKRGDYASAHESYTVALAPLPSTHPIAIVVYSNRSLTALKTGDAKTAVSDADQALSIIGAGQGVSETIDLGSNEGQKDMREFFGKALMRKAEALEHLEKWSDAASVWRTAIEAGVGGSISLRGRDRCDKAATPKPAALPTKAAPARSKTPSYAKAPPPKSLGNSDQRPSLSSSQSADAVKKLREANAAAERADDEKFALTDQVDARLIAWKGGKTDNLRALLQSLDTVLWSDAGWKKVVMSDLVMPSKVKIIYMKAIAKVHPDKVGLFF